VSLFGGIQPARLRSYLQDALQDGPANDGLIQRFQNLVWPDPPKNWKLIDRIPDPEAESKARLVFERLAALSSDSPKVLQFSPQGQELFDAWITELESAKLRSDALAPAMVAHFSKYRSLMPVLGGLFELADWAADLGSGDQISLAHARQAAALCEYLESHAKRVYSCITSPELRAARELGQHIERGDLGKQFTIRGVYRRDWSGLSTPTLARAAAELLEDAGWVRPVALGQTVGRPSETFDVNPAVWEGL
jgi:hypothetical protein